MVSGIALGPVPEFEGHRLDTLHTGSRRLGQFGTLVLGAGIFLGAGVLGRAALSERPRAERMVSISLTEEVPAFFPGEAMASVAVLHEVKGSASSALPSMVPPPVPESTTTQQAPGGAQPAPSALPRDASATQGGMGLLGEGHEGRGGAGIGQSVPGATPGGSPGQGAGYPALSHGHHAAAYRSALATWLAARRRYPAAARNQGRQGEVLLALEIDAQGGITLVRIERSSGHDLLDQAALALVKGCGTLPPPPLGLRQVRVAVDYSLA